MFGRWSGLLFAAVAATGAAVVIAIPAGAEPALSQTVGAQVSTPALIDAQKVEVCLQVGTEPQDCQVSEEIAGADAEEMKVALHYSLLDADPLPAVNADAGTPTDCDQTDPTTGVVTKRVGAVVEASEATFTSGSSVALFIDDKKVAGIAPTPDPKQTFQRVYAKVCVVSSPIG